MITMPRKTASTETVDTATSMSVDVAEEKPVKKPMRAKKVQHGVHDYVSVYNGFNGMLVYRNQKTGERIIWEQFGDVQDMEFGDLKNCRSASRGYFEKNWFLFDDPSVVEELGVGRLYKDALTLQEFDTIFELTPDEIRERVEKLSDGQRTSLAYRARQLINEGEIDSRKVVAALEESLGVELIEK